MGSVNEKATIATEERSSNEHTTKKVKDIIDNEDTCDTNTTSPSTPLMNENKISDGNDSAKDESSSASTSGATKDNIDGDTVVGDNLDSGVQTPTKKEEEKNDPAQIQQTRSVEKGKLKALKEKALAEYDAMAQKQRFQRLHFLLERSTLYSSFLMEKMESQRKEQREREEKEKEEKEKNEDEVAEKEEVPETPKKRRGRRRKAAAVSEEGDEARTTNKRKRLRKDDSSYQLSDYIDPETMKTREGNVSTSLAVPDAKKQKVEAEKKTVEEKEKAWNEASPRQPKLLTGGVMRDYQLDGMEWMVSLYENGLNGILADEMGLGKTIQTISFLTYLRERGVWGPFLIVCPLSTLANWVSEFMRFVPTVPVLLYHGNPEERTFLRSKHLKKLDDNFPIVCTTYELVMNDRKHLQRYAWKYIVVDEGHRIKNLNCKLVRELKSYQSANRLLLTGTPLQNNLSELWALLNFLLPDIFDDLESFQSWFDFDDIQSKEAQDRIFNEETSNHIVSKLHHILQPFLLRRLKIDVEHNLPRKREYIITCPITNMQRGFYDAVVKKNLSKFILKKMLESQDSNVDISNLIDFSDDDDDDDKQKLQLKGETKSGSSLLLKEAARFTKSIDNSTGPLELNASGRVKRRTTTRLKTFRIPDLHEVDGSHITDLQNPDNVEVFKTNSYDDADPSKKAAKAVGSMALKSRLMQFRKVCNHPYLFDFPVIDPNDPESEYVIDERLVRTSGKFLVLDRLLPCLFERGHRVLLFSQMSRVLDILGFYFEMRGWEFCRLDGGMRQDDRQANIDHFNKNHHVKLFLLTTRAGGVGINLASADTVIIFDSDWNPQMDLQAQDRAHRIGQTKPVIVYRLVIGGTAEGKILERANAKRKLEKLVIHKEKFKGVANKAAAGGSASSIDTAFKSSSGVNSKGMSLTELADILASEDGEGVNSAEAQKVANVVDGLDLSEAIPKELILTDKELEIITDRSPEAYERAKKEKEAQDSIEEVETGAEAIGSTKDLEKKRSVLEKSISSSSKIRHMDTARDEQNDVLANL
ncbi:putative ATPase [Mycoemilia scoparia]|uniref:ATPase n=1 Tax=Mycoemilia scoparia TaxID=417184 RepID=A0A9W7ZTQ3_9FUNG|nr:putative ATPase [Mycoemilia scoparia]